MNPLFLGLMAAYLLVQGAVLFQKTPESPNSSATCINPSRSQETTVLNDLTAIYTYMKSYTTSRWLTEGFHKAQNHAKKVESLIGHLAVLRGYLSGFSKSQLAIIPSEMPSSFYYPGFFIKKQGNTFILAWKPAQSTHLPPVGARLISCDNQDPQKLYEKNVAPFMGNYSDAASLLLIDTNNPFVSKITSCIFECNGSQHTINLSWQEISAKDLFTQLQKIHQQIHYKLSAVIYPQIMLSAPHKKILLPSKHAWLWCQ